jgi:diguanylate cyclase (GGDEF)-like protein/PAS domain S-box-containing protein
MSLLPLSPHGTWLEQLHQKGELYKHIVETTLEGIWVIDAEARTVFVNEQMARILRCRIDQMVGAHLFAFMDAEARPAGMRQLEQRKHGVRALHEFQFRAGNGEVVWARLSTSPLLDRDGRYVGALAMVTDITARKLAERLLTEANRDLERHVQERTEQLLEQNRKLEELASRDVLTGVLNRRTFNERLQQEVSRARRHDGRLSALVLDVDHFKKVNDSVGHIAGDAVLRQLASLIVQAVRDSDTVARYGGEEFVVLAPQTSRAGALMVAERVRRLVALATDRCWAGTLTLSIGIAELKRPPDTAESLLARADAAMQQAKQSGRDRVSGA